MEAIDGSHLWVKVSAFGMSLHGISIPQMGLPLKCQSLLLYIAVTEVSADELDR